MAVISFIAKSSLAPGYISGQSYDIEFECSQYEVDIRPVSEDSVSLSGKRETVLHRRERTWDVTTGAHIGLSADQLMCFLASVQDGSAFTFDRYATLSGSTIITDRPITCELASDGSRKRLGNRSDAFQFSFKIREIEDDTPLYGENFYWDLDLTRGAVPDGWTYTRTGTMYAMDTDGIFKPYAADVMPSHYDMVNERQMGAWFGISTTNSLLYSSDISNAVWVANSVSKAAASSIIQGGTAQKITNTGSGGNVVQTLGTFGTNPDTVFAIVEKGDSDICRVRLYDNTAAADRLVATLTFSTGAVVRSGSDASGNVRAWKIANTGPNGGEVWLIALTTSAGALTNGNARRVYVHAADPASSTQFGYVHHVQLHANSSNSANHAIPCPPIVTSGTSATRGADALVNSNVPAWWTQRDFTMGIEYTQKDTANLGGSWLMTVSDATSNNYAAFDFSSGGGLRARQIIAAVSQASMPLTQTPGTKVRAAMRAETDNFASYSNQSPTASSDTNAALFSVASKFTVGCAYNSGSPAHVYVSRALFAPEGWSNEELKAWTT